jgi:hypothetical protein
MLVAQECVANLRSIVLEARKVHSRQDYARMAQPILAGSPAPGTRDSSVSDLGSGTACGELGTLALFFHYFQDTGD